MKTLPSLVFLLFITILNSQIVSAQDNVARDKKMIQAAYDALNRRDWTAFAALCTDDYTDVNVGPMSVSGIQPVIDLYKQFFTAFPDFKITVNEIVPASDHNYLVRVMLSGTNTGNFMMLPATGKPIKFNDIDIVRLNAAGKVSTHAITNPGEPLRQIGYGSFNNPNTGIIMKLYELFGSGNVKELLNNCTDDVVFEIQDHMFDNQARWFKGKNEVASFFQELDHKFNYTKFQPYRFISDGDDVIILVNAEYTLKSSGKNYATTYTHHFTVKDGKITYFRGVDDFQKMK